MMQIKIDINCKGFNIRDKLLKLAGYSYQKNRYDVTCYCGEKLKVEHNGMEECSVCGWFTYLSGTHQVCGNWAKFSHETGPDCWTPKEEFEAAMNRQIEAWCNSIKL